MIARAVHARSRGQVAVKTFSNAKVARDPQLLGSMRSEISVLWSLQPSWHAGIANMVDLLQAPSSTSILLEYCGGGSLQRRMAGHRIRREGMPPPEARMLTAQLAGALAHLHGMGVAHRDVKPDNILYTDVAQVRGGGRCMAGLVGAGGDEGQGRPRPFPPFSSPVPRLPSTDAHPRQASPAPPSSPEPPFSPLSQTHIKLCDFGFAKHCSADGRLRSVCGSPQYMAPEINGHNYHGPPVDVWAVGAVVYELLHGCPAFRGSSLAEMAMRILKASHGPIGPHVPAAARGLLRSALMADPAERITAVAVVRHELVGGAGGIDSGQMVEARRPQA
jgi:serine/threonine protein kinase